MVQSMSRKATFFAGLMFVRLHWKKCVGLGLWRRPQTIRRFWSDFQQASFVDGTPRKLSDNGYLGY